MENNTIPRERDGSACVLLLCVSVYVCYMLVRHWFRTFAHILAFDYYYCFSHALAAMPNSFSPNNSQCIISHVTIAECL